MMQKKLLSGLFWVLLANLLVKPFWILGIEVGVQNSVGAEMYGLYIGIFNLAYIFNILLDLGITSFNTRNIAQSPKLIDKHLPAIISIKVMLLALYIVVTFTVGLLLGYDAMHFKLLAWLSFNQFLNSFILYLRSNFEGLLLFKWDSLLSVLDRVLMILICGTMLWGPSIVGNSHFTIYHFVYAQTAAYLITAAVALAVLARRTGLRRLRWNKPFTLSILRKSLPFALLVLLMASYNRLDPIMLQKLSPSGMGNFNSGIYAGAFRLLDALTMIAYLVSVPLLPVFSKMTKGQGYHAELSETTRMVFSLMMVFSVTAACLLSAVGDSLMALFYDENIADYSAVFRILIYGIIPISATYVFGTLLTAGGYLNRLNILAAVTLVINIAINALCIPRFGAVGSAWAAMSAQSFMAISQIIVALKIFKISVSAGYIIKLTSFTLIIVAMSFCAPHLSWWLFLAIAGVTAVVAAMLLKLIDIREMGKIMKEE